MTKKDAYFNRSEKTDSNRSLNGRRTQEKACSNVAVCLRREDSGYRVS